ncbi:uncharacterized protein LOC131322149 isoform X2 [Rhododendron vialii]|uniref:uncharacterized protein LOC131322149 isoform X2 n=1 Tax=Rhododendron vialii TaxID=182163 RepID=UPI0026605010|nr:uncharacterized protein LOC131322149 isoform X2 [Rhododendron vialii]
MDRNGPLCVIFLFLIASHCSSAYSPWNLRKLTGAAPTVSPLLSPVSSSGDKESKANPIDGGKSKEKEHKDSESSNGLTKVNPKGSKSDDSENSSTKEVEGEKSREEKNEGKFVPHLAGKETCDGSTNQCSILETLTGCIQRFETGSKDLVLLIQNEGESAVKGNITISTSLGKVMNYEIPKHQTEGISVSQTIGGNTRTKIILKSGNGECTLQMGPHQSKGDFLQRLPSYYKQLTPIYGAYLLFLIALIVGGTWACCKIRKRKRHDGVPYQELEMGVPESASAVNLEAAEGWDDGWDDDWDEDKAVRSPGGRHVGSISSSGLTARSANKDGWGNDWDD